MNQFFFAPNGTGSGGGLTLYTQTLNNNATNTNITEALFDSASELGVQIRYLADRGTDTAAEKNTQMGFIYVAYDKEASAWVISEGDLQGDAGVTFSVSAGQVRYTTSNLAGANYYGNLYFYIEPYTI